MKSSSPRRAAGIGATGLVMAIGLSACGSFDSAVSGERLIRDYVKQRGQGRATLKSVSCPSGVKQQVGHTFDCKVVLHLAASNSDRQATITVHMAAHNEVVIEGAQDIHLQ